MGQNLDPNLKPEKQHIIPKQGNKERLCIGQGSKRKRPSNLSQKIPGRTEIETRKTNHVHTKDLMHSINNASGKMTNNNPLIPDVSFHLGPVYRSPPKPIKQDVMHPQSSQSSTNIGNYNPNFDFKENSPFQEGIMSETFQRSGKYFFQELKELGNLIYKGNLIHKYLPKQTDIDKILEVIQRKVLKGSHLLVKIKQIQTGYLHSSYLKTCTCTCHKLNCLLLKQQ